MTVTLHADGATITGASTPEEEREVRELIDYEEVEMAFIPNPGEYMTLFTRIGWFHLYVESRFVSAATSDAEVWDGKKGGTWYDIWFDKIEFMERYDNR